MLLLTAHQRLATQLAGGLQATGAEVRHLADALEARVLLEKSRASGFAFDLVVVDGNMPPPVVPNWWSFLPLLPRGRSEWPM